MSLDAPDDTRPDADPPAQGGTTEVPDEPLGVPADGDSDVGDQPGLPDVEPPAAG